MVQYLKKGSFPCSVIADDRYMFPAFYLKAYIFEKRLGRECLSKFLYGQDIISTGAGRL